MELQKVKIDSLQPHPDNYNRHTEEQLVELGKSLEQFNQFKNIVVCHNTIIAGHGLVEAAKRKDMTEIYALVRDDLTIEEQKKLLIADNATAAIALPDVNALQELMSSMPGVDDIPGVTDEFLHSIQVSQASDINIDDLFVEDNEGERQKVPEIVTCPHCGEDFEA